MDYNKAIEKAIRHFQCMASDAKVVLDSGFGTHPGESDLVYRNRKMYAELAIQALETMAQLENRGITQDIILEYAKFEDECVEKGFSFNSLLEAREKQTPYKPTKCDITLGRCKCGVGFLDKSTNYCGNCGQKLDWGDKNEID